MPTRFFVEREQKKGVTGKRTNFEKHDSSMLLGRGHDAAANPTALAPILEELKPIQVLDVRRSC